MNIPQPAPTLRATIQPGLFRLIDLPVRRSPSPGKLPLTGFPSRPLRVLHQFPPCKRRRLALPSPFQFFHFRLQSFQLFLQSLDDRMFPHQFGLQFRNPLVFCTGLGRLVPSVAHPDKSTTFIVLPTRVFQLNYSCLLTLFTIRLVYAKQVPKKNGNINSSIYMIDIDGTNKTLIFDCSPNICQYLSWAP
jgi:hypothetical protein